LTGHRPSAFNAAMLKLSLFVLALGVRPALAADQWSDTIDRVAPSIVSLKVDVVRPFDTEEPRNTVATGFVVDAERGILMTNRHVVGPGPIVAEAVLLNNEELPVWPIYRDPVHDFGFFRFDPKDVRFQNLPALTLAPDGARVGVDIRVVGNDAGEKLSILAGTIARLDREAPSYGKGRYNDFDTFYIQAASGTSGGSSGSPVIDLAGRVVALNAGSRRAAATSYFLPLDRAVRALALIQAGEPVPRGTLQMVVRQAPYDEVRRLGLASATEATLRQAHPSATGALVVDAVIPEGPSAKLLVPGDVLVRVDGALIASPYDLESVLDERVGQVVHLEVERGGQPIAFDLPVGDLHAITPATYLEIGGGAFNELSFQQARSFDLPVGGPSLVGGGYAWSIAGVPVGAVIRSVGAAKTPDLAALEAAWTSLPEGARVPVRFQALGDPGREQVAVVRIDHTWFPERTCSRDDSDGSWPCLPSSASTAVLAPTPGPQTTQPPRAGPRWARRVASSLVRVDFDIPLRVEGVYGSSFAGTGVVVDAARGLVMVDRDTVPVLLGDVTLTFFGSARVPGRVLALHPVVNLALIEYDPSALAETGVAGARMAIRSPGEGDATRLVGLDSRGELRWRETEVDRRVPLSTARPQIPFFQATDQEVLHLKDSTSTSGGVLVDRRGRVAAAWWSFADLSGERPTARLQGVPVEDLQRALAPLLAQTSVRTLGVTLGSITLAEARDRGLSDQSAQAIAAVAPQGALCFVVERRTSGAPAVDLMQDGDVLVRVDGQPIRAARDVDAAIADGQVHLTVLRDGAEVEIAVPALELDRTGVTRVVSWAGALVHAPHHALLSQRGGAVDGVYVASTAPGSPAARNGLRATRRIIEVDGRPTPDLDAFLAAVHGRDDRAAVRLLAVDLDGRTEAITLRLDLRYFDTSELRWTDNGAWDRGEPAVSTVAPVEEPL
jgi:pro-apoptotic serine protease NMA111